MFFRGKMCTISVLQIFHNMHGPDVSPPTLSYFLVKWEENCKESKVRHVKWFSVCSAYEQITVALSQCARNGCSPKEILPQRNIYKACVANERHSYQIRKMKTMRYPLQCCIIIIDGADQTAFGHPNFKTRTKDVKGTAVKVRLIVVLEHRNLKRRHSLYIMTEEIQTDTNHIIETLHHFINCRKSQGLLPNKSNGDFSAIRYTPDINLVFVCVEHVTRNEQFGWLLRFIHKIGSSMFVKVV